MATHQHPGQSIHYRGFFIYPAPLKHHDPPEKCRPWAVRVCIGRRDGEKAGQVWFTICDRFARSGEQAAGMSIDLGKTIIDGLYLADQPVNNGRQDDLPCREKNPVRLPVRRINMN